MRGYRRKGISTVAGAVLFIILIFALQTTLFLAIYRYNSSIQEAIKTENERVQEKIVLASLVTDNSTGIEQVYALSINNSGAITVRIRAIYVDNQFICDPSDPSINPDDTYVNAKETSWIFMPPGVIYNATSIMTIATERGTKSTDYEWRLKQTGGERPPSRFDKFYLGPLMLDFNKFYFAKVDPRTGDIISPWRHGWQILAGTGSIAWNITVKNIDERDITINQFSVFTLWANDQPSNRLPWYIEPPINRLTQHIKSNETVQIIYKWSTPKANQTRNPNTQGIYNTEARCRNFLTFFGIFHELDGTTKPYGQTIPFEAVLVEKASFQISASPSIIAANSTMYSTITVFVTKGGSPLPGTTVTFTTTAGTLSSLSAVTDVTGNARVYLYPEAYPAVATVTATWITLTAPTTVRFETPVVVLTSSPTIIATNSTMTSTITAMVKLGTFPSSGIVVTFTSDAGTLSAPTAITDANGIALVTLAPSMVPALANVTAAWLDLREVASIRVTKLYVATDRQTYAQNDTVMISGLLRDDSGGPIQGTVVSIDIAASNGTVIWSMVSNPTDLDGAFTHDLVLVNASPDTYTVIVTYQTYQERYHTFVVG